METNEVNTGSMPKKKKIEQKQQLVQVKWSNTKGKMKKKNVEDQQKQEEPETTKLQIQEYLFDGQTPNRHASKGYWLESYRERANKFFNETSKLYNEVIQFPYPNVALKIVSDHAIDTLILALTVGNKLSKVNVNIKNVPTTNTIHLNREVGDIFNTRLLKETLQISKMEESKTKTIVLLRRVRIKNKALKIQINNLYNESVQIDGPTYKGALSQRLLDEKEKEIQLLKRKLKIPSTKLTQTYELAEIEKEKETLNIELTDWKANMLKLEEKERKWEVDTKILKESKKELKATLATKEKELQEMHRGCNSTSKCSWRSRH